MKKYIFFIRSYNDWDNIAPIIYYLAKNENFKIYICFYRIDLRHTSLFKYLEKSVGNSLQVFFFKPKKFEKTFNLIILILNKFFSILKMDIKLKGNIYAPDKNLVDWIKKMNLHEYKRVIVVFDRILDPFVKKVQRLLKGLDYNLISCPHGPMTNVNRMIYKHEKKRVQNNKALFKYFQTYDYMIFVDKLEFNFDEKFHIKKQEKINIDFTKILVLGSIRYCPEWLMHVDSFNPKLIKKNDNKIKIVFFMKKFAHNVFVDEVYRTLDIFASFPNIDFYIVPHTRGMSFSIKNHAPNVYIDDQSTSTSLINMADVILFYGGTSIVLEPLVKKKLVACIDYLDCNRNIYEYHDACHVLKCRDDLCFFLDSIIENKIKNINGENLLKEMIYAGDYSTPVSERYINFFKNL